MLVRSRARREEIDQLKADHKKIMKQEISEVDENMEQSSLGKGQKQGYGVTAKLEDNDEGTRKVVDEYQLDEKDMELEIPKSLTKE